MALSASRSREGASVRPSRRGASTLGGRRRAGGRGPGGRTTSGTGTGATGDSCDGTTSPFPRRARGDTPETSRMATLRVPGRSTAPSLSSRRRATFSRRPQGLRRRARSGAHLEAGGMGRRAPAVRKPRPLGPDAARRGRANRERGRRSAFPERPSRRTRRPGPGRPGGRGGR